MRSLLTNELWGRWNSRWNGTGKTRYAVRDRPENSQIKGTVDTYGNLRCARLLKSKTCMPETLYPDFAGRGVTLAFSGGSVGAEGVRRLHVGHIHVMQGKVHPQRALWLKNDPSPGQGCGKRIIRLFRLSQRPVYSVYGGRAAFME